MALSMCRRKESYAGIEMLRKDTFDVLLLDVEMPGKNGIETLRQIRGEGLGKEMRVLFLTGNEESEVSGAIKELRADGYIKKPFKPAAATASSNPIS